MDLESSASILLIDRDLGALLRFVLAFLKIAASGK